MLRAFVAVWHDVTDAVEAMTDVRAAGERMREFALRVDQVRRDEQRSASRTIHDRLGQALTLLGLELHQLTEALEHRDDALATRARRLEGDVGGALAAMRDVVATLRPPVLEDLGLEPALQWLAERVTSRAGLALQCDFSGVTLPLEQAEVFYAIMQEALTNVVRHARATRVTLRVVRAAGATVLEVADDGVGLPAGFATKGLGLLGMRERAASIGATVEVASATPRGTCVRVRLPVAAVL